ncbi:MAG: hypothetical protein ABIU29_07160 [Chthoniobacterales bacterium]
MKTPLLLALLAGLLYYYYQDTPAPRSAASAQAAMTKVATQSARQANPAAGIVIAALPPYSERWKTGPNAQTDLKTGPKAQLDLEPFAPSEMATWNRSCGYTIVSGVSLRR